VAVEATREYRGLYHALLGHLSPLHGVGPDDLTIDRLEERCRGGEVRELIWRPTRRRGGDHRALHRPPAAAALTYGQPAGIRRPVGGDLSAVDPADLAQALQLRRKL